MTDYEKLMKALECCSAEGSERCEECPYTNKCRQKDKDAIELILELKAQLEQPVNDGAECTAMPNYEEINRKLEDKLCKAECEHERTQRALSEMQKELEYLRAVKATAEAFLGRKIEG